MSDLQYCAYPGAGEKHRELYGHQQAVRVGDRIEISGQGWSQVFRVNSYHLPLNNEGLELMKEGFEKWMPGHMPIWTAVGVQRLGIEVVAYDPK
ncbi:putative L-PSP endoribonuclease family protein [Dendryphion nanum]|uniref:L-PSP endoribonuclease family protein n=1 Tax=Dendryphion nanum TaxID=256645 RepID=A0A9P9D4X4_9PLEO|nr:putative L-PSP endoribonuclease family protein [Dendryphion nanum]